MLILGVKESLDLYLPSVEDLRTTVSRMEKIRLLSFISYWRKNLSVEQLIRSPWIYDLQDIKVGKVADELGIIGFIPGMIRPGLDSNDNLIHRYECCYNWNRHDKNAMWQHCGSVYHICNEFQDSTPDMVRIEPKDILRGVKEIRRRIT